MQVRDILETAQSSDPTYAQIYRNLILLLPFLEEQSKSDYTFADEHDALIIFIAYLSSSPSPYFSSLSPRLSYVLEPLKQRLSKGNITPDQNDFNEVVNCGLLLLQENIINYSPNHEDSSSSQSSLDTTLGRLVEPKRLVPSYEADKIKQSYSWCLGRQQNLLQCKQDIEDIKKNRSWITGLCLIPVVFGLFALYGICQDLIKGNMTIIGGISLFIISLMISCVPFLPVYIIHCHFNDTEESLNVAIEKARKTDPVVVTRTLSSKKDYEAHQNFRKVLKQEQADVVKDHPSHIGGKPKKIVQNVEARVVLYMDSKQAQRFDTYEALRQARLPGSNQSQGSNQSLPDVTTFFSTLKQSKLESKMLKLALFQDWEKKHST